MRLSRGLLIFNGTHFLQITEGSPHAIDDLVERLRRDQRHSGVEVRDERTIEKRSFSRLVDGACAVLSGFFKAKDPSGIGFRMRLRPTCGT